METIANVVDMVRGARCSAGETQNRGGEQLVAASRVLLRSLIDFILELLRELQGDGNCHYKLPRSLAMIRTQAMQI
jgi:hypothetical protein